jgi:hypothetical protein
MCDELIDERKEVEAKEVLKMILIQFDWFQIYYR